MSTSYNSDGDIFLPGGRLRQERFSEAALMVLGEAMRLARETNWDSIRSPHIFMGLLSVPDPGVRNWGMRIRADLPRLLDQFQELFQQESTGQEPLILLNREFLSDNALRLLRDASQRAADSGRQRVAPMDLLIGLLTASNSIVAECFESIGVTAAKLTELAVIAERQG